MNHEKRCSFFGKIIGDRVKPYFIIYDCTRLVPLGSLNDVHTILEQHSFNELLIITISGVIQFALLLGGVIFFIGKRYPIWVKLWLVIHQSFIFLGALIAWWIPYLFGIGAEQRVERYNQMFGTTHTFLPVMNGIVPNTLHTVFHLVLLICIVLTLYISLTSSSKKHKGNSNPRHEQIN